MPASETCTFNLGPALENIRSLLEGRTPQGEKEPAPALEVLAMRFGLSEFEQAVLVLCAGIEIDSSFSLVCAAQGDGAQAYPTFSLVLKSFPNPHWSALSPAGPLRKWRLIEVLNQPGYLLVNCPLKIDERILHFLSGIEYLDERLAGVMQPQQTSDAVAPSHAVVARSMADVWRHGGTNAAILHLCSADEGTKRSITGVACKQAGFQMYVLPADHIPGSPSELEALMRLWERESRLCSGALHVDAESAEGNEPKAAMQVSKFLEGVSGPVVLSTRDRWRALRRAVRSFDVGKPTSQEQQIIWETALAESPIHLNGQIGSLVGQFNLSAPAIRLVSAEALERNSSGESLAHALWEAGRSQSRARLGELAQRIEPAAQWDDLVLPGNEKSVLREIAIHLKHRRTVYESWGFGATSSRGLGISALFSGSSGTGKTMAAEVLANALRLDLFRIDLSTVVSKYIGETEKNLRRVFDAAEEGGAILFFDEADALFGKRSEVKDSHDRYANIEVNYLLQRMECYRGLAVLATNMRSALDTAFLRRIRFVVNFPFPEFAQRAEIWERVFPRTVPVERLNVNMLARLQITGGNIRNIALNAVFLAAEDNLPVRMKHLAHAARSEFAKLEKPLPEAEIRDWV